MGSCFWIGYKSRDKYIFFDERVRSFLSRTAITLKFKIRWFPDEISNWAIFGKCPEIFGECSKTFVWHSSQFWKIFENLRKVVGNLRKIVKFYMEIRNLFSRVEKYFTGERSERVKHFSTLEDKFRISARPCNILYFANHDSDGNDTLQAEPFLTVHELYLSVIKDKAKRYKRGSARWVWRRERPKTKGLMFTTMAMHVRFESLYISLPSSAKQQQGA